MTSIGNEALPPPPPPPIPPSPPTSWQHGSNIGVNEGSPCSLTSPVEHITREVSAQSLGHEAYEMFHNMQSDLRNSENHCYISFYQPVYPILQNGPACGIVALAMSASLLGIPDVKIEHLYNRSRELNLSKQGELFSVDYMTRLAQDTLGCSAVMLDVRGDSERKQIVKNLLGNAVLLIPYDSDKNHRPCLKNGHKAHWAVITGFFLVLDNELEPTIRSFCSSDSEHCGLYHCADPSSLLLLQHSIQHVTVYGQQGKSKYPGVWPLEDLLSSNMNLREVDPDRAAEADRYVIPPGGVLQGLCGRIVILSKD